MFKFFIDGLIVLGGHQWEEGRSKCLTPGLCKLGLAEPCSCPACHREAARAAWAAGSVICPEIWLFHILKEDLCARVMVTCYVLLSFYKVVIFSTPESVLA